MYTHTCIIQPRRPAPGAHVAGPPRAAKHKCVYSVYSYYYYYYYDYCYYYGGY